MKTSKQLMNETMDEFLKRKENRDAYKGTPTGIADLDKLLGGFQKGWYIVIGAPSGVGKTTLTLQIFLRMLEEGRRGVWFAAEELEYGTGIRIIANKSGIKRDKIRDLVTTDEEDVLMQEAADEFAVTTGNFESQTFDLDQFEQKIANRPSIDLVVFDYLQLMNVDGYNKSRTEEVSAISRAFRKIANDGANMKTVIAIAQLNDEGSTLWSKDLIRDADVFIKLLPVTNEEDERIPNELEMIVEKSRHSEASSMEQHYKLYFDGSTGRVGSQMYPAENTSMSKRH